MYITLFRIISILEQTATLSANSYAVPQKSLPQSKCSEHSKQSGQSKLPIIDAEDSKIATELKIAKELTISKEANEATEANKLKTLANYLSLNFNIQAHKLDTDLFKQINSLLKIFQYCIEYLNFNTEWDLLLLISKLSKRLEDSLAHSEWLDSVRIGSDLATFETENTYSVRKYKQSIQKEIRAINLSLQTAVANVVNFSLTLNLLKDLQARYQDFLAKQNLKSQPKESINDIIYRLTNETHGEYLKEQGYSADHFSYASALSNMLVLRMHKINYIMGFTRKFGIAAEPLRLFSQSNQPASQLSAFCVGFGGEWALNILKCPQSHLNRKPSFELSQCLASLVDWESERLPSILPSFYIWLGDPMITQQTLSLQLYLTKSFEQNIPDYFAQTYCSGYTVAKAVLELFQKKPQKNTTKTTDTSGIEVSVIAATLATINNEGQHLVQFPYRPHMLWFVKLTSGDAKKDHPQQPNSIYYFLDTEFIEMKFYTENSLCEWLNDYFESTDLSNGSMHYPYKYSQIFNSFTLNFRNEILQTILQYPLVINPNKTIYQYLLDQHPSVADSSTVSAASDASTANTASHASIVSTMSTMSTMSTASSTTNVMTSANPIASSAQISIEFSTVGSPLLFSEPLSISKVRNLNSKNIQSTSSAAITATAAANLHSNPKSSASIARANLSARVKK